MPETLAPKNGELPLTLTCPAAECSYVGTKVQIARHSRVHKGPARKPIIDPHRALLHELGALVSAWYDEIVSGDADVKTRQRMARYPQELSEAIARAQTR